MNFIDNTNKCACVKIHAVTQSTKTNAFQSSSDRPPEVNIRQPYNTHELANRLKYLVLKKCGYHNVCTGVLISP
jgi:hypothetical protein